MSFGVFNRNLKSTGDWYFLNEDAWAQCYKTFFARNLRAFIVS